MATPMELINRAAGESLTDLAKRGFGGWILAVAASAISGTQAAFQLLFIAPINILIDIMQQSANALILKPLGIPIQGAQITTREISVFGIFALPVGVVIVLVTLAIVMFYRRQAFTSDTFAGVGIDLIPFVGQEDEQEEG